MNIGYFSMHCSSIGDTIAAARLFYSIRQYAIQKNLKIIGILHITLFDQLVSLVNTKKIDPIDSIYTPFLNLQKKAKLIDDFTFISGIDNDNINIRENNEIVKEVIKRYFATKNDQIERILDSNEFHAIYNNIKKEEIVYFYTNQFNFLKKDIVDSYGIIQYCSYHYRKENLDEYNKCYKRISFENIKKWIDETKLKTYKFIGSQYDENDTIYVINKLKFIYTDINFINLCGMTLIEDAFKEIYNSTDVLSTESYVGLLGGVFNKPSKLYFRYNNLKVMNDFKNHMIDFNKLMIEPDKKLTEND